MRYEPRLQLSTLQELNQSFAELFRDFRQESFPDSSVIRDALFAALAQIPNGVNLEELTDDEQFLKLFVQNTSVLLNEKPGRWIALAGRYLFSLQAGDRHECVIEYYVEDSIERENLDLTSFISALTDPHELLRQIHEKEELIKINTGDSRGTFEEIHRQRSGLRAAELLAPDVLRFSQIIQLLCLQRPPADAVPYITIAARKLQLVKLFDPIFSERFLKRFYFRFKDSLSASPKLKRTAFMNTIGEYVLLGFGILTPSIFKLQSWNQAKDPKLEAELNALGFTFDEIVGPKPKRQYCNRWALTGQTLNAKTDHEVLGFITRLVRKEESALFDAFDFDAFISELIELKDDCSRKSEVLAAWGEALLELLHGEELSQVILDAGTRTWYPALRKFMG
jgi:hypothetical protein